MKKDIIVKKSKISGRGVFATRDFKKGEVIFKWNPRAITKSKVDKLSKKDKHYLVYDGRNKYFLMQQPERYVNHSCDPNTSVRKNADVARRDIKKGEEITSNYARAKGGNKVAFECRCGSLNCKKIVEIK